jgi:hypothetical protein
MERSRVTVQYNYLPGQVFEHETEGLYCVVRKIEGPHPDLGLTQVLEAIQLRLDQWRAQGGTVDGFPPNLPDYPETFKLVRPRDVEFDVWPQLLYCARVGCGHVISIAEGETELERNQCLRCHQGRYRQFPYYRIHTCGRRLTLSRPRCPQHGTESLLFEDTGSFHTANFRCGVCGTPLGMSFTRCRCRWGPDDARSKTMQPVTARDSRAFYGHRVTLINIPAGQISSALAAPHGPHYALGHYMGTITNLSGLKDEASGRVRSTDDAESDETLATLRATPGVPDDVIRHVEAMINERRGDLPFLEATERMLERGVLDEARHDRRMMERALLFADGGVDPLGDTGERIRTGGHHGLAARIDAGLATARRYGIANVSLVRDFPIALVGFGYTRVTDTVLAQLKPFEAPGRRGDDEQIPLIGIDARTEGILVELDALVLWRWAAANGWTQTDEPPDAQAARAWVLNTTYGVGGEREAALAIQRVTHVFSHLLTMALDRRSSFSSNSAGEYLLERSAGFLIYVAKFTAFNLGGLIALAEQHLDTWLRDGIEGGMACVHDPVCLTQRGGCHKCIAMAFGCERFNRGLDRGYLVGGGPQSIREGFLYAAQRGM